MPKGSQCMMHRPVVCDMAVQWQPHSAKVLRLALKTRSGEQHTLIGGMKSYISQYLWTTVTPVSGRVSTYQRCCFQICSIAVVKTASIPRQKFSAIVLYLCGEVDHFEQVWRRLIFVLLHPRGTDQFWGLDGSVQIKFQQSDLTGDLHRVQLQTCQHNIFSRHPVS